MSELREEIILILDTSRYTDCFGELEVEKAADAIINLINTESQAGDVGELVAEIDAAYEHWQKATMPSSTASKGAMEVRYERFQLLINRHWKTLRTALTRSDAGWRETVKTLVDALELYVPSPQCRGCADHDGQCANSLSGKKPCDPAFYQAFAQSARDRAVHLINTGPEREASNGD